MPINEALLTTLVRLVIRLLLHRGIVQKIRTAGITGRQQYPANGRRAAGKTVSIGLKFRMRG